MLDLQTNRRTLRIEWVRWWCDMNLSCGDSRELMALAVALSMLLAQGQDAQQLGRPAAFFTVVGDTLALFALQPLAHSRRSFSGSFSVRDTPMVESGRMTFTFPWRSSWNSSSRFSLYTWARCSITCRKLG